MITREDHGSPQSLACFLMTFLDPDQRDECDAVVSLMKRMIPLYCENKKPKRDPDD